MPRIGSVDGMTFSVYFNDHQPPHFHARAAGSEALIAIDPLRILESDLTARQERAALAWAAENIETIRKAWSDCNG